MDDAQGHSEVAITMTGDELGRIVGAAVGAALAARDRAVAEELRDLRLGQGTLTQAIGAIERHADERHQDVLTALDELKGTAGMAAAGSDADARSGPELPLGGMEQVRDAALMGDVHGRAGAARGGAGHDPLPPQPFHPRRDLGGDLDGMKDEGLQEESLGSAANCSMNAARRLRGASPNRSMM